MRLDAVAQAAEIARRRIRTRSDDVIVADLAHRAVAAEDPDPDGAGDPVPVHLRHRHLVDRDGPQRRRADAVPLDHGACRVDHDALLATRDRAAFDRAHGQIGGERDVDALRVAAGRGDRAVANRHLAPANVDPVDSRAGHADTVEHDVPYSVDDDSVLAADDGDILHGDVTRADDDPTAHDRAPLADHVLATSDHERALVDPRGQVDGGPERRPVDAAGGHEGGDGERGGPGADA